MMVDLTFHNPFKPGAGHMPPYLAGRHPEKQEFLKLLDQETILKNMILTGLRGVGKTVLLDTLKPIAIQHGWQWVGADLSESTSVTEDTLAIRLLADMSIITSHLAISQKEVANIGFIKKLTKVETHLDYEFLRHVFDSIPGLVYDKLTQTLEGVWPLIQHTGKKGVIFAYDEAQTISNHPKRQQYPLSLLLNVFQSLQKKGIPFMLGLTGLPTLFPKLVEARTFSERMFNIIFLDRLNPQDSKEAILQPIPKNSPVIFSNQMVASIVEKSGGYPYFIQFICKEAFDHLLQSQNQTYIIPMKAIIEKLDKDFFSGRWAKATDRQRELLYVIANLDHCDQEFSVQEIVDRSKILHKPFGSSHVNQMLSSMTNMGLIYKNRHGKYSFAVPLLGGFIKRQYEEDKKLQSR